MMTDGVRVFFVEPTHREKRWLRRHSSSSERKCGATGHYCNAMFALPDGDIRYTPEGYIAERSDLAPPRDDQRWPAKCDACGVAFGDKDAYQVFGRRIYARIDTGFTATWEEMPPGACRDLPWISERREGRTGCGPMVGPDGRTLMVKCPDGHEWIIDSRASNCTMPNDDEHWCWVRRGKPEDGTLHVDKAGRTCAAGAGSIQTPNWHGFLHNGVLHT